MFSLIKSQTMSVNFQFNKLLKHDTSGDLLILVFYHIKSELLFWPDNKHPESVILIPLLSKKMGLHLIACDRTVLQLYVTQRYHSQATIH